ncbi:unnamed protein product, partial [Nesidiocoris tenuis]
MRRKQFFDKFPTTVAMVDLSLRRSAPKIKSQFPLSAASRVGGSQILIPSGAESMSCPKAATDMSA